jgi:hypothetical protein
MDEQVENKSGCGPKIIGRNIFFGCVALNSAAWRALKPVRYGPGGLDDVHLLVIA